MAHIDARTTVCALFGHPVGHSLSPAIHNAAFEALGLPFVYVAHDVEPGHVGTALNGIRANLKITGSSGELEAQGHKWFVNSGWQERSEKLYSLASEVDRALNGTIRVSR